MKKNFDYRSMLVSVAKALGEELCNEMAFVGGCTTALLLTDSFSIENVRHTVDVDLIVHAISRKQHYETEEKLRDRGFKQKIFSDEAGLDDVICTMWLEDLRVDFMPDNPDIFGFSNSWYREALEHAEEHELAPGITIKVVSPVYFIATKLEAYSSRGKNDPLTSDDAADIIALFEGRESLVDEIKDSKEDLKKFISANLKSLVENDQFDYAVQSFAGGAQDIEKMIYSRMISITDSI